MDTDLLFQKVQTLFAHYYGQKSITLSLLQQVLSTEGVAPYLQEISTYDRERMDEVIPEMIFASLFSICGFHVTFIGRSEPGPWPELRIMKGQINAFIKVGQIKTIDFERKEKTTPLATLADSNDSEILESYVDLARAERILREKIEYSLECLRECSRKDTSINMAIVAVWNSVDAAENLDIGSSIGPLLLEINGSDIEPSDALLVYGSMYASDTNFHVHPVSLAPPVIALDFIRTIEEKTIEDVCGIHTISVFDLMKRKKIK